MSWQNVEDFNTRQEIVKCVVVGDTAVGKTRLICAKACDTYVTISQMISTHIPTVWAIDQYRIHKEVLKKSWMVIDGVNVSMRLWDTFGDHEKDRKFAFGRADVVILCFSISNPQSFKHCKTKWLPEIRHNCPNAPLILVGCKNDLRHVFRDEEFQQLMRERRVHNRIVQENEFITREQGRQMAEDIGAVYYESSVWTHYGIHTVFENAMRLALLSRRQQRFWVKSLKNVTPPILQEPFCPPKPAEPTAKISETTFGEDMRSLLDKEYATDVDLAVGQTSFHVHRIILAAASSYFKQLFISSSRKDSSTVTLPTFGKLSSGSVWMFIRFLYTGDLTLLPRNIEDFRKAVAITDIWELTSLVDLIEKQKEGQYAARDKFLEVLQRNMNKLWCEKMFTDVTFTVDNGKCYAHRCVLMARCVVMNAMFGGEFRESTADVIPFPGVSTNTFNLFLHYIYTDTVKEKITVNNCLEIIELANRLCLPRLISLVEFHVIVELCKMESNGEVLHEHVLRLLEPCQIHNAFQLAEWCQYYITTHYQDISANDSKLIRNLHQDNQAYLNMNRWPPLHFLKEQEYYERCVREQEHIEKPHKFLLWKTAKKKVSGCLNPKNKIPLLNDPNTKTVRMRSFSS